MSAEANDEEAYCDHCGGGVIASLKRQFCALNFCQGPSRPDQDQTLHMNASNTRHLRHRRRLQKRPRSLSAHVNSIALSPQDPTQELVTNINQTNGNHPPNQEAYHPAWKPPKTPLNPFPLHLPDDILRSIFEYAATDLDTACALVLVAFHIRTWVDPILYSRVRLEGLEPIRFFARTIEATLELEASISGTRDDESRPPLPRIAKLPSFFGHVRSLTIIPQEQRVLLFHRDVARHATLILNACVNVVELEASGDFLRRIGVSHDNLEQSDPGLGDGDGTEAPPGTGGSAGPNTPIFSTQGLEEALMRPTHLTLVPPTSNVFFRLPILSNITHLHYLATLPRNLNYQGTLLCLTHVAFDYPLGVASAKTETLIQLLRTALEWGVPSALAEQDTPEADEDENELVSPATIIPPLTMVVVRVLLRPRVMNSDRDAEVWRKLADLSRQDSRLVYFDSQGLFGEDVWEIARTRAVTLGRLSTSWYRE
jgi:hypothetical protein